MPPLDNKSGEDLVQCKECGDYFYSFNFKLKLCFWCDMRLEEE
jgi:formylmethanofuran dehydrogenase subunit E